MDQVFVYTFSGEVHPPPTQRRGQEKGASLLSPSMAMVIVEYFLVCISSAGVFHVCVCVCVCENVCVAAQFHFFFLHSIDPGPGNIGVKLQP